MPYDDAETALAAAMQGIPLEQALLQQRARRAQGFMGTPLPEGRQVGRVYRAASPLEALASALSRGLGARDMRQVEQDWQGLAGRAQQAGLAGARVARADKEREFGLKQQAGDLANMQAMSREAEAARDAQYRQEELGLKRQDLGLRRSELAAGREEKKRTASAKAIEDLRKEFQGGQTYKNTQTIAESFKKIAGTSDTGPGDVSLIYSYMRMVDPGSTVREGEFATAANAGGIPDRIVGLYNKALSGEKLPPEIRKQFRTEAKSLLKAQADRYEETAKPYRRLAEQQGLPSGDVVLDLGLGALLGDEAGAPPAPEPAAALRKKYGL